MKSVFGVWEAFMKAWVDLLEPLGDEAIEVIRYLSKSEAVEDLKAVVSLAIEKYRQSIRYIIDCDADPFVPQPQVYKVEEHIKNGQLKWGPSLVKLYLDEGQKNGNRIKGDKLRKLLAGKKVHNACLLFFLLAHQELIPEKWKNKRILFWGTIYRSGVNLYVFYLYWNGDEDKWAWGDYWVGGDLGDGLVAAISE